MAMARFRKRFAQVESFLRASAPGDVLMPSARKAPAFAHKGGRWTWKSYDRYVAVCDDATAPDEACVLLNQLCVVDVDSMKQASALEAAFPCLADAPCEATSRGRHYWFRRSARADAMGYYDGSAQRVSGVDFKTRCSTGTAGVVVVAPSAGRVWIRPLHDSILEPIPDDLLDAVAVPRCTVRAYDLKFACGASATIETAHLGTMAYFEPFLDDDGGLGTRVPVPCDERSMRSLLAVLAFVERSDPYEQPLPPGASFDEAVELVDKLGGDAAGLRERLVRGAAFWRADLRAAWPAMDNALALEAAWGADAVRDIEVGTAIRYTPAGPQERRATWLFDDDPTRRHYEGDTVVPSFSPVDIEAVLPEVVRTAMRRHPLVLAGGAALALLSPRVMSSSGGAVADWDLFPYGVDEDAADAILRDVESTMDGWRAIRTPRAFTFVCPPSDSAVHAMTSAVQIVLRLSETPADVLVGFDLPPCKVALFYDGGGNLRAVAAPSWFESMRRMAFPVPVHRWCKSSSLRVIKYVARGFDTMLPGVRRTFVRPQQQRQNGACRGGISVLLVAETIMGGCRPFHKSMWLLQRMLAKQCGTGVTSNYECVVKARGPLGLVYAVCMAAVGLLGRRGPEEPTRWRRDGAAIGQESARMWNVHPTNCDGFVNEAWVVLTSHDALAAAAHALPGDAIAVVSGSR